MIETATVAAILLGAICIGGGFLFGELLVLSSGSRNELTLYAFVSVVSGGLAVYLTASAIVDGILAFFAIVSVSGISGILRGWAYKLYHKR